MNDLDLAWQTYQFHGEEIHKYEELHLSNLKKLKIFKQKKVAPTEAEKQRLYKIMVRCCDNLIVNYKKQIDSIKDLVKIYDSDTGIGKSRDIDTNFLNDLANITATLMEEMNKYKYEIKEFLN